MKHVPFKLGKLGIVAATMAGIVLGGVTAFASAPQFDSGAELSTGAPYESAQGIKGDIFGNFSIYGKLEGTTPIDIYAFTASKDGDVSLGLMTRQTGQKEAAEAQPVAILADPTDSTKADSINLPTPDDTYHFALIHQITDAKKAFTEPALLQKFNVVGEQVLSVKKDKKYYLLIAPGSSTVAADPYVIRFGNAKSWGVKDVVTHFGSWLSLQTNSYANSSPFKFNTSVFSALILLLGFAMLLGIVLIQEIFSLLANKAKSAGYLLIKLQPFSRILIWVGAWLLILGEYILFDRQGWGGIPFVLSLISVPLVINLAYVSFGLSRRIEKLEVSKKEATIPFSLRKRWFFSSLVSLLTFGSFAVYLTMYLVNR